MAINLENFVTNLTFKYNKAGLKNAETGLSRFRQKAKKHSLAIKTAFATAIGFSVREAVGFDRGFSKVLTLFNRKAGETTEQMRDRFDGMKDDFKAIGSEFGISLDSINKAGFDLISAGVANQENIAEILRASAVGAIAGGADIATSAKAIGAVINTFGGEAGGATNVMAAFFAAQRAGITDFQKMADGISQVSTGAKQLGVSFQETLAVASALTTTGTDQSVAYTQLRNIFDGVVRSQLKFDRIQKRLKGKNVDITGLQDIFTQKSFREVGILKTLKKARELMVKNNISADDQNIIWQQITGSTEGLQGIQVLLGSGYEGANLLLEQILNKTQNIKNLTDAQKLTTDGIAASWDRILTSISAIAETIGQIFAPILKNLADILGMVQALIGGDIGGLKKATQKRSEDEKSIFGYGFIDAFSDIFNLLSSPISPTVAGATTTNNNNATNSPTVNVTVNGDASRETASYIADQTYNVLNNFASPIQS